MSAGRRQAGALLAGLLLTGALAAQPAVPPALLARLAETLPEIAAEDVRPSGVPGLYEVRRGTAIGYVTADGEYLIAGDLVALRSGESLTERRRMQLRVEALRPLLAEAIVFAPPQPRYWLTILTDTECQYCRALHSEMPRINALGIAVQYLFYPRKGPLSSDFRQAQDVYCASDRRQALTRAKQGRKLDSPVCEDPVLAQFTAAQALGIRGTPAMVLPDGALHYGYMTPEALLGLFEPGPAEGLPGALPAGP